MMYVKGITNLRRDLLKLQPIRKFYDWRTSSQTIFAPATTIDPKKGSPLGIIRVSGVYSAKLIEQLTPLAVTRRDHHEIKDLSGPPQKIIKTRHATMSKIIDPISKDLIDIGLVLWFAKPNSYTGEDVCEFHVHGSQAIMTKMMNILGGFEDLRPAEPGEFTRRAVTNGKLSLMQAESLPELIAAQTDQQRKMALNGLIGKTCQKYDSWIEQLVTILAHLEASIDFGEDELIGEQRVVSECIAKLGVLHEDIRAFIELSSRCRDLIQCGARVAILGRPNAGKSTFMNMLCRQDKSIVSSLSGTTRDVIEHPIELNGHRITLSDTAGLRELSKLELSPKTTTSDSIETTVIEQHNSIEREGIKRALEAAKMSDLVIYLVDSVQLMAHNGPASILKELEDVHCLINKDEQRQSQIKTIHLVINKIDLFQIDSNGDKNWQKLVEKKVEELKSLIGDMPLEWKGESVEVSQLSCKTHENFESVIEKISNSLAQICSLDVDDGTCNGNNLDYVNERHLSLLRSTARHLDRARQLDISTIDEMAQHTRESVDYLSRIVGRVSNEQVIDVIFRDFCIGK